MNLLKKNINKLSLIAFMLFAPLISFAQYSGGAPVQPATTTKIQNPISINSLTDFIRTLLIGVLKIGIPIVALAIIYCGFLFVAARGNSEKLSKAKATLLYTLIGAAILLGSWAIATLISDTVLAL